MVFNLFKPNAIEYFPTLISKTSSFSILRVLGGIFYLIQILIEHSVANSGDPDQMPNFAASGLGLHCLPFRVVPQKMMLSLHVLKTHNRF